MLSSASYQLSACLPSPGDCVSKSVNNPHSQLMVTSSLFWQYQNFDKGCPTFKIDRLTKNGIIRQILLIKYLHINQVALAIKYANKQFSQTSSQQLSKQSSPKTFQFSKATNFLFRQCGQSKVFQPFTSQLSAFLRVSIRKSSLLYIFGN